MRHSVPMKQNLLTFSNSFKDPHTIGNWGPLIIDESSKYDVEKEVTDYLKTKAGIPQETALWNRDKITTLVQVSKSRKRKYFLSSVIPPVLFTSGSLLLLFWIQREEYFLFFIAFTLCLSATIMWKLKTKFTINHSPIIIENFFSEKLKQKEKELLSIAIRDIQKSGELFWNGNHDKRYKIPKDAYTAENWFLLLTGIESDRKGIFLEGRIPTGSIKIGKYVKERTKNSRDYGLQELHLNSSKKMKTVYSKIIELTKDGYKLGSKGRAARLQAMKYCIENPKFYDSICKLETVSEKIRTLNSSKNHYEELYKIFAPVMRNNSTLLNASKSKLIENFITLRDRELDNWLEEIL